MSFIRAIGCALIFLLGGYLVYLGDLDDSPGLGGIGIVLMLICTVWLMRRILSRKS
ncbi:hypothetical protein QVA66_03355 [Staphylococcus chromogenes]|nr:hypothetical protein [Staphylococcus chromogenes]